jgi:aminotransferase
MKSSTVKVRPDIRQITRLVPPSGNLVQGQSELPIHPELAMHAARIIANNENHYGGSEGNAALRKAVADKLSKYNGISVDVDAIPHQVVITNGGTGAIVGIAQGHLVGKSALVFEPYYQYHRRILEEFGAKTETFELDDSLSFSKDELAVRCRQLKNRSEFPLRAIILCTPANPSGKVFTGAELQAIAELATELDLLVISDEVYEHFVTGDSPHQSIAALPGMFERTLTVNSFSKSWNISGWRLGYCYGNPKLLSAVNNASNAFYVCAATPLQSALSSVLMADESYYLRMKENFTRKRAFVADALTELGFNHYESGSSFYIWTRIPEGHGDAMAFNQKLMESHGVAGVPGCAFADSDAWDNHMRICVAREDSILESAIDKFRLALK